jgi:folate receptor
MLALSLGFAAIANAWTPDGCKPFKEIYTDGEDLINRMWGNSFKYEADESKAYTMWWTEGGAAGTADAHGNPNELITQGLGLTVPDQCHLDYYHKDAPTPEGEDFSECHPWHASSCCHQATVMTPTAINEAYGPGYEWDRCGPMSQACERFFVEEACFYECDVNMGLYRRFTDEQHTLCSAEGVAVGATVTLADGTAYTCVDEWGANAENKWEIHQMPIKASYADAFYRACANDLFCDVGGFWDCNANYKEYMAEREAELAANATREVLEVYPLAIGEQVLAANVTDAAEAKAMAEALLAAQLKVAAAEANATAEAKLAAQLKADLEEEKEKPLEPWAIALIIVCVVLASLCACGACYLVSREKQGKPVFQALEAPNAKSAVELNNNNA